MENIKLKQNYLSWLNAKNNNNSIERYCASRRGIDVSSEIEEKDLTLRCGCNVYGFNVNDTLSVGSPEDVNRQIKDISIDVATAFIAQGWAEEVV